ncbi:hypothetical protein ACHAPJ_000338 [Fusarium lateritium]
MQDWTWTETEVLQITATCTMNLSTSGYSIPYLYRWLEQPSHTQSWAEMARSCLAGTTKKREIRLRILLHCSDALGHLDSLMKSVRLLPGPRMTADENPGMSEHEFYETAVAKMVRAAPDYIFAVTIWDMYNEGRSEPEKLSWHVWVPHMKKIVLDPDLPPNLIWSIADFLPDKASHRLPWWMKGNVRHTIQALEKIGNWYMKRPNLTHRGRIRYIEKAIVLAQATRRDMPQSLMQNLAELLVSDLEMGRMGRKTRLQYLVVKMEQFYGKKQARKVAIQLDGWRWTIRDRMGKVMQMPLDERGLNRQMSESEDWETQREEEDNSFEGLMKAQRRKTSESLEGNPMF